MNVIFVYSRGRGTEHNRTGGETVHISVPCELVMGLLSQGAILQMQISPVSLRPDLTRPSPRPDSVRTSPRPDAVRTNPRPDFGRSQTSTSTPERPASRCPTARPISPYTDWSSLTDQADVISVHNDNSDNNYVPRSPAYEPDSPGPNPVEESEDWDPTPAEEAPEDQYEEPSRTAFVTFLLTLETILEPGIQMQGQEILWEEEFLYKEFLLFSGV